MNLKISKHFISIYVLTKSRNLERILTYIRAIFSEFDYFRAEWTFFHALHRKLHSFRLINLEFPVTLMNENALFPG